MRTYILEYLRFEGYPTQAISGFKESNVNDLVLYTMGPVGEGILTTSHDAKPQQTSVAKLGSSIVERGRDIVLKREKEIIAVDGETGGYQEFVVMDIIGIKEEKFVIVVEAKASCIGLALKQCLLALKDMLVNNGGGLVYGFVTTGEFWRMVRYDGTSFTLTNVFMVLFNTMRDEKDRWMSECSVLVDCLNVALNVGGIVEDVVVGASSGGGAKPH